MKEPVSAILRCRSREMIRGKLSSSRWSARRAVCTMEKNSTPSIQMDEEGTMNGGKKKAELKSFGKPDEVRSFPKGKVELVKIGGAMVGRATLEPGWKWSESVKPIAKTKSCEAPHFQYQLSGTLHIVMDDGTAFDSKAGDVTLLPVGHDAWVIGDKPVVLIDFQGMIDYARSK